MIERTLLDTLEERLRNLGLAPAPALIGVVEPSVDTDLPALVISIEQTTRPANGLGERSTLITNGALAWQALIDLANPVLPSDPSFSLLSAGRMQLALPHGGLVRSDGSTGALRPGDIQVQVVGNPRTLVTAAPGPNEFTAEPLAGTLTFGQALPPNGTLRVNYFVGQWEQRVVSSNGVLRLSVVAANAAAVRDLSNSAMAALGEPPAISASTAPRLTISEIGSIGPADPPLAAARRRVVRFQFEFQQEINQPESSGGVIQRIPVQSTVQ